MILLRINIPTVYIKWKCYEQHRVKLSSSSSTTESSDMNETICDTFSSFLSEIFPILETVRKEVDYELTADDITSDANTIDEAIRDENSIIMEIVMLDTTEMSRSNTVAEGLSSSSI